jgi:hypothetical protein
MPIEILIINTVLCLLGIVPAFAVQMATVMGGAAVGAGSLGARIAVLGYIFPAAPIISIIGSWVAHLLGITWLAAAFVALPWVYTLALGAMLLIFFRAPKTPG